MITSSAPGKIILFGEHAVVYGRPALAVPVTQVQATVAVSDSAADSRIGADSRKTDIWIDAPDIDLHAPLSGLSPDQPLAAAARAVLSALGVDRPPALTVRVSSTIPVASGLGSGAAVTVALVRSLSAFLGRPLADEQVNALAFDIEKLHHGTPSGIDNTVITYARPVYFVKGQPIETLRVGEAFTLVIGDTGISAPTRESVGDVRKLWQVKPDRFEVIFDRIGAIADRARQAIEAGDAAALGPLMDENHALLDQLTVSSPELDRLVAAARGSGALGAKLSGGGRGGNMIALVRPQDVEPVSLALQAAGAKRTLATIVSPE
jgi:mevalonate kinase